MLTKHRQKKKKYHSNKNQKMQGKIKLKLNQKSSIRNKKYEVFIDENFIGNIDYKSPKLDYIANIGNHKILIKGNDFEKDGTTNMFPHNRPTILGLVQISRSAHGPMAHVRRLRHLTRRKRTRNSKQQRLQLCNRRTNERLGRDIRTSRRWIILLR